MIYNMKQVTLMRVNDVIYSRDVHCIEIINKICCDPNISDDIKDILNRELYRILEENKIEFELSSYGFTIHNDSITDFITKKRNHFITQSIYKLLFKLKLDHYVYNTKLSFFNNKNIDNIDTTPNTFFIRDGFIDDRKILESNGIKFKDESWIDEDKVLGKLIEIGQHKDDEHLLVKLTLFSGDIEDVDWLFNESRLIIDKTLIQHISVETIIINYSNSHLERIKNFYEKRVTNPRFGLIRLFDTDFSQKQGR